MQASYCVQGPGWEDVVYNDASLTPTTTTGGAPGPTQTGIVAGCEEWHVVKANDTCPGIAKQYSISQAQFYAWNPAIGADCIDLEIDDAYCVKALTTTSTTTASSVASQTSTGTSLRPPGPTQANIPSNCNAYALAQTPPFQVFTNHFLPHKAFGQRRPTALVSKRESHEPVDSHRRLKLF